MGGAGRKRAIESRWVLRQTKIWEKGFHVQFSFWAGSQIYDAADVTFIVQDLSLALLPFFGLGFNVLDFRVQVLQQSNELLTSKTSKSRFKPQPPIP